jgi:hypothetical protein
VIDQSKKPEIKRSYKMGSQNFNNLKKVDWIKKFANKRLLRSSLTIIAFIVIFFLNKSTHAQLPFEQSFRNSTAEGFFFGGNPNPAFLTSGSIDPEGAGVLRLTSNSGEQTGFVYSSGIALPSAGLQIEFEYFTYGGNGADGIAFFLFDADADPFQIGGFGGSLGYAQRSTNLPGVSRAYLGIGLDEFGNFSNPSEGRQGGPGRIQQSVTLRGAGNGNATTSNNYPYLTHVQVSQPPFDFNIEGGGTTRTTDPSNARYRKVIIRMKPHNTGGFFIDLDIITGGIPTVTHNILTDFEYTVIPPDAFRLGFSSSTGGSNNYHEIRDLKIKAFDTSSLIAPSAYNITAATCTGQSVEINLNNNVNTHGTALNFINLNSLDLNPTNESTIHTLDLPGKGSFVYNRNQQRLIFYPVDGFQGIASTDFTIMDAFGMKSNIASITVDVSDDLCRECFASDGMNNIFGMVFNDLNGNGNLNTGETGLESIRLDLYRDVNNNGLIETTDPLVATEESAEDGSFIFSIPPYYETRNVRDNFSNNNASGNNGTHNWKNNWTTGSNTSFSNNQLRLRRHNSQATRRADLSGAKNAQLTIDYAGAGTNPNIVIEISRNTGTDNTFFQLLNITTSGAGVFNMDISDYISENTTLRIRAMSGGNNDGVNINFADITYQILPETNYILKLTEPLPFGYTQSSSPATVSFTFAEPGDAACNVLFGILIPQPAFDLKQRFLTINGETFSTMYCKEGDIIHFELSLENTGNVPINNLSFLTPNTSSVPVYVSGDDNGNGILNRNEKWIYHLQHVVTEANLQSEEFINSINVTGTDPYGTDIEDNNLIEVLRNNQLPVWLQSMPVNITVSCDNVPEPPASVLARDNCHHSVNVSFTEEISAGSCNGTYLITRTWTATDDCNNTISHTQIITVEDTTAPVWAQAMPANVTVQCNAIPSRSCRNYRHRQLRY